MQVRRFIVQFLTTIYKNVNASMLVRVSRAAGPRTLVRVSRARMESFCFLEPSQVMDSWYMHARLVMLLRVSGYSRL